MRWKELLELVGTRLFFPPTVLSTRDTITGSDRVALSRWVKSGRVIRIRQGLYALSDQYRSRPIHPFSAANAVRTPSAVSLESALEFYGVIGSDWRGITRIRKQKTDYSHYLESEQSVVLSITTGKPGTVVTPLGVFIYHHVVDGWFDPGKEVGLGIDQQARIVDAEKALLDVFYFTPGTDERSFYRMLNPTAIWLIDDRKLMRMARDTGIERIRVAAARIALPIRAHQRKWEG